MNRKYILVGIFFLLGSAEVWACEHCRPGVESGVYNADFIANFSLLVLPLGFLLRWA